MLHWELIWENRGSEFNNYFKLPFQIQEAQTLIWFCNIAANGPKHRFSCVKGRFYTQLTFLINWFIIQLTFIGQLLQSARCFGFFLKEVDWRTVLWLFWTKPLMLVWCFMISCGPTIALYEPSRNPVSCWYPVLFITFAQALGSFLKCAICTPTSGPSNSSFPYLCPS